MEEPQKDMHGEDPADRNSGPEKKDGSLVDELKKLLSGLGTETPQAADPENSFPAHTEFSIGGESEEYRSSESLPESGGDVSIGRPTQSVDPSRPTEKHSEPNPFEESVGFLSDATKQADFGPDLDEGPLGSNDQPDDKEFWRGNVLGWGENAEPSAGPAPEPPENEPIADSIFSAPPKPPPPPPVADILIEPNRPPTPEPFDEPISDHRAFSSPPTEAFEEPSPEPVPEPAQDSVPEAETPEVNVAPEDPASVLSDDSPPIPSDEPINFESSFFDEAAALSASFPDDPDKIQAASSEAPIFGESEPVGHVFSDEPEPVESPEASSVERDFQMPIQPTVPKSVPPDPGDDEEIPIPGTIEKRRPPSGSPDDDALESGSMRPEGVVQVACFFPEGSEKVAKGFIRRLKDVSGRSRERIELEPVFMQKWNASSVDFSAWESSAQMAGADFRIILATRDDKTLFSKKMQEAKRGDWPGRIIFTDQLSLRSLYADLVLQIGRSK